MDPGPHKTDAPTKPPSGETEHAAATRLVRRRAGRKRRWRWIAAAVVTLVLGGLGVTAALLAPRLGKRLVRTRVLPALEKRFNRKIHVGRMHGTTNRLVLENVRVAGSKDCAGKALMRAERVILTYDFWPLLSGKLRLTSLTVVRPRFCLRRHADGTDNVTDLLGRLARRRMSHRLKMKLSAVVLRHGALEGRDELRGLHVKAPSFDAKLRPGGRSEVTLGQVWVSSKQLAPLQAKRVQFTFRTRLGKLLKWPKVTFNGARLRLHDKLVLTDMAGQVTATKGRLLVALSGSYGGLDQVLWRAKIQARLAGLADPRRAEVSVQLKADRFSLDKLTPILPKRLIPNPSLAQLSADLALNLTKGQLTFAGNASLSGLTVKDPYLSGLPVENLGFEGHVKGSYLVARDLLRIERARLKVRRLQVELTAEVLRLRGKPRIKIAVTIPRTRCSHVADAIPRGMIPRLSKMRVAGWFSMKVEAEADFRYLTTSSVYLNGRVDAKRCRVTAVDWELSAARLASAFGHELVDAGNRIGFEVGPDNPDFIPLAQISPSIIKAILTTEDSRFFYHRGFIPREFQTALARNLIARRFVFGASSITMQMVKNVLLGRSKTLSRKLQELILTWYLEKHLRKDRILEIYLNVIEFGPGIFGIGRAAQHLFGKDASALEPQEAAYLASILPSPKRHYKKFCRGQVGKRWRHWVDRILRIMHRRKRLDKSQLDLALVSPVKFSETERGSWAACMARLDRFRGRGRPHRIVRPRKRKRPRR
jgi:Transglycosylase/Domain of Unknown Function (DUF748)